MRVCSLLLFSWQEAPLLGRWRMERQPKRKGDYATSLQIFRPLAEQGNADAQFNLGLMFVKGQGVASDLNVAQSWFNRAATNAAASKETREDAIYNRDFISRKTKELAEAGAALGPPPKPSRSPINPSLGLIGPAPDGEATIVAQRIILENFDPPDCPLVLRALRFGDGSIKAFCNNGESYRIFSFQSKQLAMRCSVVNQFGAGC
jgi:TPR repeat protein